MDIHVPLGEPFPEAVYTEICAIRSALEGHARANMYGINVESKKAISSSSRDFYNRLGYMQDSPS